MRGCGHSLSALAFASGSFGASCRGRAALSTTLERVSSALGAEFYIGPARTPRAARARRGYEGHTVRERLASGEEAARPWVAKLQGELRTGFREDLARVLREITGAEPDSMPPKRPSAGAE